MADGDKEYRLGECAGVQTAAFHVMERAIKCFKDGHEAASLHREMAKQLEVIHDNMMKVYRTDFPDPMDDIDKLLDEIQ